MPRIHSYVLLVQTKVLLMTEASLIIRITVKCGEVMTQQAQAFHQKYRQPQIIFPDYDSGLNMNTSSKYSQIQSNGIDESQNIN